MTNMPAAVEPALRRLERRLAVGLFLDVWPLWAVASLLSSGLVVLICRLFFPRASPHLPWLWLAPVLALVPALVISRLRAYRPDQVVALADWLAGGRGVLVAMHESGDRQWADAPLVERASRFAIPATRPWRRLSPIAPALAFLAIALWLPQRTSPESQAALADDIAGDLEATVAQLKQQDLVTPEEEKKIEEEIERIRKGAEQRVDASSWEAADALRERLVADLSAKNDALKWAEESLARLESAAAGGSSGDSKAQATAAELAQALEQLAKSGLLAGAPPELQQLLKGGKLPTDPKALSQLAASLSKHLRETNGRFGDLAKLGKEFGRFNPGEFPLGSGEGDGSEPGRGGVSRGRADAELTLGDPSPTVDRFKATPLPPGAPRSADDWAPLVELPGTPQESAVVSARGAARQYDASAGQAAWRRSLAPRHHSALKKYFAK